MSTSDILWWLVYSGVAALKNDPNFGARTHKWFHDLSFIVERERVMVDYKPVMLKMGFQSRFNRWMSSTSDWPVKNRVEACKRWLDEARLTEVRANVTAVRSVMKALRSTMVLDRDVQRKMRKRKAIDAVITGMVGREGHSRVDLSSPVSRTYESPDGLASVTFLDQLNEYEQLLSSMSKRG